MHQSRGSYWFQGLIREQFANSMKKEGRKSVELHDNFFDMKCIYDYSQNFQEIRFKTIFGIDEGTLLSWSTP